MHHHFVASIFLHFDMGSDYIGFELKHLGFNQILNLYYQRWSRGPKARGKGHKKISRPRTDLLEAKDQGHRRKCSLKKKRSSKFFSGDLKKRSSKIFFQAICT